VLKYDKSRGVKVGGDGRRDATIW